jgi:hypothetical protein
MTHVSISDLAKALIALEAERVALYARACYVTARQEALIENFHHQMKQLSNDHHLIIAQLAACEETAERLALGKL